MSASKKTLMVAGCSFSAVSDESEFKGLHWSEKLAVGLDYKLVNLARQGCGNGAVRLQIEEIIDKSPDLAIIMPTYWDRIEIPATACKEFEWGAKTTGRRSLDHNEPNCYDAELKLKNINYYNNDYRMISETMFSLLDNFSHPYRKYKISQEANTAIKLYIQQLYDHNWKRQIDQWIIRDGLLALARRNIPVLIFCDLLWPSRFYNDSLSLHSHRIKFFDNAVPVESIWNERESIASICNNNPPEGLDPGFHSTVAAQQKIAEIIQKYISKTWIL
jgi:hypothetical protein